jgi:hypothetical protein
VQRYVLDSARLRFLPSLPHQAAGPTESGYGFRVPRRSIPLEDIRPRIAERARLERRLWTHFGRFFPIFFRADDYSDRFRYRIGQDSFEQNDKRRDRYRSRCQKQHPPSKEQSGNENGNHQSIRRFFRESNSTSYFLNAPADACGLLCVSEGKYLFRMRYPSNTASPAANARGFRTSAFTRR